MKAEQNFGRSLKKLDVAAAGRTAAVAINRRGAGLALTVGAAILLAVVGRAGATGVRALFILVSHFSNLLLVVDGAGQSERYSSSQSAGSARAYSSRG
jgi:hypothetical protein